MKALFTSLHDRSSNGMKYTQDEMKHALITFLPDKRSSRERLDALYLHLFLMSSNWMDYQNLHVIREVSRVSSSSVYWVSRIG